MLREAKNGGFVVQGAWFWKRYAFRAGKYQVPKGMKPALYVEAEVTQRTEALPVLYVGGRQYWWCRDRFWWEDDGLSGDDVYALVYERERRKQRRLERAHAVLTTDALPAQPRRDVIPTEVRRAVFERDRGRCVECGSNFDLQYDHMIPLCRGGANTVANLQILCAPCNQAKGASI